MMTTDEFPAFISGSFVKKFPFYGTIAQAIGSLFVERADANSRNTTVTIQKHNEQLAAIKERVGKINSDSNYAPLCIFPEGCTTNGTSLLRFKRGAFEAESPILPLYIKYYSPFCNVSYDAIPTLLHFMLIGCQPFIFTTIYRLPVIYPTEYMLRKYGGEGKANSDVYAEVVRDIYCRTFGLKKATQSLVDKTKLLEYLYNFSKTKLD